MVTLWGGHPKLLFVSKKNWQADLISFSIRSVEAFIQSELKWTQKYDSNDCRMLPVQRLYYANAYNSANRGNEPLFITTDKFM